MKEHLRMDGIKVFEEESKLLQLVMLEHNTKNKSEAWRIALHEYSKNRNITQSFSALKNEFQATKDEIVQLKLAIEDLYFIVQSMGRSNSHDAS
jgi:hypothetical protein